MSSNTKKCRVRFTVPEGDNEVIKWLKSQDNASISLRMLIRDAINQIGYSDYFMASKPVKTENRASVLQKPAPKKEAPIKKEVSEEKEASGENIKQSLGSFLDM